MEEVTTKFEFEMEDWMALQKYHLKNSKQYKRIKMIVIALVPVCFSIAIINQLFQGNFNIIVFLIFSVITILWLLLYPKRMDNNALKRAKKQLEAGDNSGILGERELTFRNNSVKHITPTSETTYKWEAIKQFGKTDSHYFLYVSAVSAVIIPKIKIEKDLQLLDEILNRNLMKQLIK